MKTYLLFSHVQCRAIVSSFTRELICHSRSNLPACNLIMRQCIWTRLRNFECRTRSALAKWREIQSGDCATLLSINSSECLRWAAFLRKRVPRSLLEQERVCMRCWYFDWNSWPRRRDTYSLAPQSGSRCRKETRACSLLVTAACHRNKLLSSLFLHA